MATAVNEGVRRRSKIGDSQIVTSAQGSTRGPRPRLPTKVKLVAALLILVAVLFALRMIVVTTIFMKGFVPIVGFAGVGILFNIGWARTIAIVILWIVAFFFGLSLALIVGIFGHRLLIEGDVRESIFALTFVSILEATSIWMLRVLIDRKIDPLFDPRRWESLRDRSEVFE